MWPHEPRKTVRLLHLYAIDPTRFTGTPDDAAEKIVWTSDVLVGTQPGTIAGLVVDMCGVVYVTDFFGDVVFGFDGTSGEQKLTRGLGGKPCQAPALNRNGMLYLGTSRDTLGRGTRAVHGVKVSPTGDFNQDWTATQWTAGPGAPGFFGDFFGGVLVRADGSGTTYTADANPEADTGAVYKFTSGGPSMAGDWPTLGCGNRRQHKARTYPYTIVGPVQSPGVDRVHGYPRCLRQRASPPCEEISRSSLRQRWIRDSHTDGPVIGANDDDWV